MNKSSIFYKVLKYKLFIYYKYRAGLIKFPNSISVNPYTKYKTKLRSVY